MQVPVGMPFAARKSGSLDVLPEAWTLGRSAMGSAQKETGPDGPDRFFSQVG
jgi:hypothetical protein